MVLLHWCRIEDAHRRVVSDREVHSTEVRPLLCHAVLYRLIELLFRNGLFLVFRHPLFLLEEQLLSCSMSHVLLVSLSIVNVILKDGCRVLIVLTADNALLLLRLSIEHLRVHLLRSS